MINSLDYNEDKVNDVFAGYLQSVKKKRVAREFTFLSNHRADLIFEDKGKVRTIESKRITPFNEKNLKQIIESAFGQIIRYSSQNSKLEIEGSIVNLISDSPLYLSPLSYYINFLSDSYGVSVVGLCLADLVKIMKEKAYREYKPDIQFIKFLEKGNVKPRKILFR